jgi:hypothetical protein
VKLWGLQGCDLGVTDIRGCTPLHVAAEHNLYDTALLLVEKVRPEAVKGLKLCSSAKTLGAAHAARPCEQSRYSRMDGSALQRFSQKLYHYAATRGAFALPVFLRFLRSQVDA